MKSLREKLRERSLQQAIDAFGKDSVVDNSPLVEEGDRRCPICQKPMKIAAYDHVVIDSCEEHGVWLDKGELEDIIRRRRRMSRQKMVERIDKAVEMTKKEMNCFTIFSVIGP